jgi:hypothetical protein
MNFKTLWRAILGAVILCGLTVPALAQIPVPPLPGLDVRIAVGSPPAIRHEHRGPSPGHGYVWVTGFWHWDGERWDWVSGRWERPPAPEVYWVAPRYNHADRGYIYEPGHWSNQRVIVGDDVRERPEWRKHEHQHERELEHERNHDYQR